MASRGQCAVNARTAVYRVLGLEAQVVRAREATNRLQASTDAMREAVNAHEKTVLELAAVESKGLRFYFGVAVGFVAVSTGAAVGEAAVCAADDGEVAGVAVPAGKTPAPEFGAAVGEEPGEG